MSIKENTLYWKNFKMPGKINCSVCGEMIQGVAESGDVLDDGYIYIEDNKVICLLCERRKLYAVIDAAREVIKRPRWEADDEGKTAMQHLADALAILSWID